LAQPATTAAATDNSSSNSSSSSTSPCTAAVGPVQHQLHLLQHEVPTETRSGLDRIAADWNVRASPTSPSPTPFPFPFPSPTEFGTIQLNGLMRKALSKAHTLHAPKKID